MGLFKKKTISERINKKWTTKTCSLQKLKDILLEEDMIEIWVRHNDTYFQIGSSSDSDKKGFFGKIYYINFSTGLSLYKLLNDKMTVSFRLRILSRFLIFNLSAARPSLIFGTTA